MKSILFFFFCFLSNVHAQQTEVDSIIVLLKKSNSKVLDTVTFNKARQLLVTTELTKKKNIRNPNTIQSA